MTTIWQKPDKFLPIKWQTLAKLGLQEYIFLQSNLKQIKHCFYSAHCSCNSACTLFFVPSPLKATPFYALRHKTLEKKYGNFLWPSIKKKKKSRNCSILISDTQTLITDALKISSDTLALTSYQDYKWTQPRTHCGYPTTRFTFNLSLSLIKNTYEKCLVGVLQSFHHD